MAIDANSGAVLESRDADAQRFPASLTKIMTLYMAFELIEKGRLTYSSKIKISQEAAKAAPSKLDLDPGEEISVLDAVKVLVTKSANDIAVAMAEHIGGSEANFARLMTKKAREIGMAQTTFKNASGLPDPGQTTTARDMLTLALRIQDDFPQHYKHFATKSFVHNGSTYHNHNSLLRSFRGSDGIKTGYTRTSGFNLVSSVHQNGKHVVAVVFGGRTAASRDAEMRALLTRALAKATTRKTRKPTLVATPRPAERPQPAAASRPAPVPVAKSATEPSPAPEPTVAEARIEVAKVRRVMVAPRVRHTAVSEEGAEPLAAANGTEEPAAADGDATPVNPRLVFAAAHGSFREPSPPMRGAEPDGAVRPPSTLQDQLAALIAANGEFAARRPSPSAGALAGPAPTYRLKGPIAPAGTSGAHASDGPSPPAPVASGGFLIQVGAYASQAEAQRQIAFVRSKAQSILSGHDATTPRVEKGSRAFYRARFAGFTSGKAAEACLDLRRRSIDCFVMKAD